MTSAFELELTRAALDDIVEVLDFSFERFGERARRRYEALIGTGLQDLRSDPARPGSVDRQEVNPGVRTYHLMHCRRRAARDGMSVAAPRHLLVYKMKAPKTVYVLRLLHDAMDLERHIPGGDPQIVP